MRKQLHVHRIEFSTTTEKSGFAFRGAAECEPWQFAISVNEHGRAHGFVVQDVFYIVWFDPEHNLYE